MAPESSQKTLSDVVCDKCGGKGSVRKDAADEFPHGAPQMSVCGQCNGLGVKASHRNLLTK